MQKHRPEMPPIWYDHAQSHDNRFNFDSHSAKCILFFLLQTSGIDGRAGEADQLSRGYLDRAGQSLREVQADLKPHLEDSAAIVNSIKDANNQSDAKTTAINA